MQMDKSDMIWPQMDAMIRMLHFLLSDLILPMERQRAESLPIILDTTRFRFRLELIRLLPICKIRPTLAFHHRAFRSIFQHRRVRTIKISASLLTDNTP